MGSKNDRPYPWKLAWKKLSKRDRSILVIFLFTICLLIYHHHHTQQHNKVEQPIDDRTDESKTTLIKASNTCNWKTEPLQGMCDTTKSTTESQQYKTAIECENGCCESNTCISFQFRQKEGCQFGGDTRLGAEKDGVSAWCEPRPPAMWNGQWVWKKNGKGGGAADACTDEGWNPKELQGQCFGLGSRKNIDEATSKGCRDACCKTKGCAIWQFRPDAGCFFNDKAHNCQQANPLDFEAFVGKRKVVEGRTYKPYAYSNDFADMA